MSSTKISITKFFARRLGVKVIIPILIVMLFVPSTISSFDAYGLNPGQVQGVQGNDCFAPLTTLIDSTYQGPIVVDSYWVDQGTASTGILSNNPVKKEIGPGEGASVFAVVLNSRSSSSILSITGFLNLPSGFVPIGSSQNPQLLQSSNQASRATSQNVAVADYNGIVLPGDSFILYFNLKVLPSAKVGPSPTTMISNYNIQGSISQQCTSALLNVPFVLPGKVILDASSSTSEIPSQTKSPISISIENKGSADATGVVATILNLGNSKGATSGGGGSLTISSGTTQIVNLGPNTFYIGTIPAKSKTVISTTVYPGTSASGSTQEVSLQVTYQNAWGSLSNAFLTTGLVISPNPPESISLSYLGNTTTPEIIAGNLDELGFAVANNSTNTMSNIILSLVPQSTSVSIVGPSTWTIPALQPGDRKVLSTKVYAANSLISTPTSFTLTANYVSKGQSQTNSLTLGTFVVGNIKLQIYSLSVSSSGGTSTIGGNLLNQGSTTGLYTTVDLAPSPLLNAIRAARLANSTNNQTGQSFQQVAGQGDQGSSGQGGQGFQGQGGQGFQGQAGQGFQGQAGQGFQGQAGQGFQGQAGQGFQGQGGRGGGGLTQQFIGDLTPDSPIPFSIPIRGLNLLQPGMYKVSLKVAYADDLKEFHTAILNGTVSIVKNSQSGNASKSSSIFDQIPLPIVIGAAIAIIAVVVFLIKRKRSKNKKLKMIAQGDSDIVSIFDSVKKKENES